MATDLMRYDAMVQGALRGVMIAALGRAAAQGLPGDHHFYVSFRTGHPGVRIPAELLAQYPEEMTIVLQHKFWDLEVSADAFSVALAFNGVPNTLAVPFDAVTGFADPSVNFGLQFNSGEADAAKAGAADTRGPPPETAGGGGGDASADVVALDTFRKK